MKIGVMSDTHLKVPDTVLNYILDDIFRDVDHIMHAGDIVSAAVLDRLEERGALAVCGNMDDFEIAESIPQVRMITLESKRIALIHGWGAKHGLQERILARLEKESADLVIYGHSHVPFWGKINGVMMFNPGSAAHDAFSDEAHVGILEILDGELSAKFVKVSRNP